MPGWDTWYAVPIDWHLTAVFGEVPVIAEGFVYSNDLWSTHGLPELWVSCLGICGHRVSEEGAAHVLNEMARRLIAGDLQPGGQHAMPFDSGAVLRFHLGPPAHGRWDELETYYAERDAPVCEVRWSCCFRVDAAA